MTPMDTLRALEQEFDAAHAAHHAAKFDSKRCPQDRAYYRGLALGYAQAAIRVRQALSDLQRKSSQRLNGGV